MKKFLFSGLTFILSITFLYSCKSKVEVPEITKEQATELMYAMADVYDNSFSWADGGMWSEGIDKYLYHKQGLYPDGIFTVRDLMEYDGLLVNEGTGVSTLNPAYEHFFEKIEGEEGSYFRAIPTLIEYEVVVPSEGTVKFLAGSDKNLDYFREVKVKYAYYPTEIAYILERYKSLVLKPKSDDPPTSLLYYEDGYLMRYDQESGKWALIDRTNILYRDSRGSIPYENPYTYKR